MNFFPEMAETHTFLSQALLKTILTFVFDLDMDIAEGWKSHHMKFGTLFTN
jgi:hypothetical protein